ncbi:MAG: tRNA adenosine(34) deaminase TadA [Planctomycetota bacterium]
MLDLPGETTGHDDTSGSIANPSQAEVDRHWMQRALELASQAVSVNEVPVGAIIIHRGQMIAAAHNQRETLHDPTAHAEMIAITQAASAIEDWRLEDTTLYVTLEPCLMCAGAILQSRVPRVVYGASDPKAGAVESLYETLTDPRLNHRCELTGGILAQPCGQILTDYFRAKRAEGKK